MHAREAKVELQQHLLDCFRLTRHRVRVCVCVCVNGWGLYPNRAPQARAQEDRPESTRPRGDAGMRASSSRFRCHYLTVQLEGKAQPARTRASTMTSYKQPRPKHVPRPAKAQVNMARERHPHTTPYASPITAKVAQPARTRASTTTGYLTAQAQARAKTSPGPGEHGTYAPPSHNARRHPVIKESLAQFGSLPTPLHCQVPRPAQHQDHTSIRPCTSRPQAAPPRKVTAMNETAWCSQ